MTLYIRNLLLFFSLVELRTIAVADDCASLHIGASLNWYPISFADSETGELKGIAIELSHYISEHLELPKKIDTKLPWARLVKYLEAGTIDMCNGIYWTKVRSDKFVFTEPYYTNEARVFVLKGKEFSFNQLSDLLGRSGGIPLGGSFGEEFDSFAKVNDLHLEGVRTKKQMIGKLLSGRNDYFIQDYHDAMSYIHAHNLTDKVVALRKPVSVTDVFMAISKKSPCKKKLAEINKIIVEAKTNGTLQGIIDRYPTHY